MAATRSSSVSDKGGNATIAPEREFAAGERPGFVECDRIDAGQALERGRALHDDAFAPQPRHRGDDGRGRRQDQRTGAGDDQHGERRPKPRAAAALHHQPINVSTAAPSTKGKKTRASRSAVRSSGVFCCVA